MTITIRDETDSNRDAVLAVHVEAFPTAAEADLVERLRDDGDVVLSLVAIENAQIVGHVMFSRMQVPANMLGLAPVAVFATHRRRGIAAQLIEQGLSRAKAQGWAVVFVLGGSYYRRFGFDPALTEGFESPFAGPHLMALELQPGALATRTGKLEYARAFAELG